MKRAKWKSQALEESEPLFEDLELIHFAFTELDKGRQEGLSGISRLPAGEILSFLKELGYEGIDLFEALILIREAEAMYLKFVIEKRKTMERIKEKEKAFRKERR